MSRSTMVKLGRKFLFLAGTSIAMGQGISASDIESHKEYQRGQFECRDLIGKERLLELEQLNTSDAEICLEAAENGDPLALAYKGNIYRDGLTGVQDSVVAFTAYQASTDGGDPYGTALLALAFERGIGVDADLEEAKRLYLLAADFGEPFAQYRIGLFFQDGTAFEKDEVAANSWLRRSAMQGHPGAQAELGLAYRLGTGELETDIDAALTWFGRAAAQDNTHALDELGLLYELGEQVEQDYVLAAKYYERSSLLGSAFASNNLAGIYQRGFGVERDWHKAIELLELAAEQGEPDALVRAGLMLDWAFDTTDNVPPQGFERNASRALEFLQKAFESDATNGGYWYAVAYREGRGTDVDIKKALSILEEAAKNGDATSAHQAGYLYNGNEGILADYTKALQYFELAASLGYEGAENDMAQHLFPQDLSSNSWLTSEKAIAPNLVDRARGEFLFWKAIDDGNQFARYNLAARYRNGDALEASIAYILYESLIDEGKDLGALGELSNLIGNGRGITRDVQKAFNIKSQIANAEPSESQDVYIYNLGMSYKLGYGVEKDAERAGELFRQAGDMGYIPSLHQLAQLSDNPERKREFHRKAAEKGYAASQDSFGAILIKEASNEAERTEAIKWFVSAFENNDFDAPYNIALAIEEYPDDAWASGLSVKDYIVWAAQRGNSQAIRHLEQVLTEAPQSAHWLASHADSLHEIGRFFESVQLYCGQIHYTCGTIQTLDLDRAAFFYLQAVKGGSAQGIVDLARLLQYYPDLTTETTLANLEDAMTQVQDPLAKARFNILVHGVERAMDIPLSDEGARFAALYEAAIGRLGPHEVASAFSALIAKSDESDPAAATALASAYAAYGAYDAAIGLVEAKRLTDLRDDWDRALTRRVLRASELGVERPEYMAETRNLVSRFETAFIANTNKPNADVNRLNLMQRLLQADQQDEVGAIDASEGYGFSAETLLTALNVDYQNALEAGGLSASLVGALEYRSEIHQQLGDLRSATHDALTSLGVRLSIIEQTHHRAGAIESNILRSCAYIESSSRMSDLGQTRLANDLAIESFNSLQHARKELLMLPSEVQTCFKEDLSILYRLTADRFVSLGNFVLAEQALISMLDFETYQFTDRKANLARTSTGAFVDSYSEVAWTISQDTFLRGTRLSARRAFLLSKEQLSDAETDEIKQLRIQIAEHTRNLQDLLDSMLETPSERQATAINREESVVSMQQASRVLRAFDEEALTVYTYVTPDKIGFILTDKFGSDALTIPVEKDVLMDRIIELRIALRREGIDPSLVASRFYSDFWKPVQDWIDAKQAKRVFVYLDGPLASVPLPALHDGDAYLVERDLTFSRIAPGAFDNASFDRTDNRSISIAAFGASKGGNGFEPLEGVPEEIDRIIKRSNDDPNGVFAGIERLDENFSEIELERALFRSSLDERSIFHLATHFELKGSESTSRILYGDGTTSSVERFRSVFGSILPAVDLIVLSACSTGVESGQAMSALTSILQYHKVESVVGSLWNVNDRATSLLMARFYHWMAQGLDAPAALRRAQLDMLKGSEDFEEWEDWMAHPIYWAPFVFSGDLNSSVSAIASNLN